MNAAFGEMTKRSATRFFEVLLLISLLSAIAQAQQTETSHEVWPEVDIYIPLVERFRLFLMARQERSSEEGRSHKVFLGAHLDYFWKKKWTLRGGYRHGFSVGPGESFKEHRFLLEETYSKRMPHRFELHVRNRQEFRNLNSEFSTRFRHRLMLERDYVFGRRSLVPYGSGEIFYDTRYNSLNRFRLIAGVQLFFKRRPSALLNLRRQKVLDLYYAWQHDSRADPKQVGAVGVRFAVHF
jgi:hypothetical protein